MRRVLLVAVMVIVAMAAACQNRVIVGQTFTVAWDAPALGTIPPAEVAYEVVVETRPGGVQRSLGDSAALERAITLESEGKYRVGVRTVRTVDGEVLFSEFAWSDVEGTPAPWYAAFYAVPAKVIRVRVK